MDQGLRVLIERSRAFRAIGRLSRFERFDGAQMLILSPDRGSKPEKTDDDRSEQQKRSGKATHASASTRPRRSVRNPRFELLYRHNPSVGHAMSAENHVLGVSAHSGTDLCDFVVVR